MQNLQALQSSSPMLFESSLIKVYKERFKVHSKSSEPTGLASLGFGD